jgi:hypothetical protein
MPFPPKGLLCLVLVVSSARRVDVLESLLPV